MHLNSCQSSKKSYMNRRFWHCTIRLHLPTSFTVTMCGEIHIRQFWNSLACYKKRIKIGNARSSWANLHKRVPQGYILGSLLFNIFINGLFLFIESGNLNNYADENTVSISAPSLSDVVSSLQLDCNHASDRFTTNSMKAYPNKFQFMILSSSSLAPVELVWMLTHV